MKKHAKIILTAVIAGVLYYIIVMLWQMAEVKMHGFSHMSFVEQVAAWTIAIGLANALIGEGEE